MRAWWCRVAGWTLMAVAAAPALAWLPTTELLMASRAAEFAPPDLARQIERHKRAYRQGVRDAATIPRVGEPLAAVIVDEIERAVRGIENHRPFSEIVHQLGVIAHYLAISNNPLSVSNGDPDESSYSEDFLRYVESAQGRFAIALRGEGRRLESSEDVRSLVSAAVSRGRALYPMIGIEYRRIGGGSGIELFDDRSTAFGLSSLALSHGVSDMIGVLRYIWLRAGGADSRDFLALTPPSDATSQ